MPKPTTIYQFKITLNYSKPSIWRRIQVPENYTFWDLHTAIQSAMGWAGGHLHGFRFLQGPSSDWVRIELPHSDCGEKDDFLNEQTTKIKDWFGERKTVCYTYDFGDSWDHSVRLEKILPVEKGIKYPRCLAGKMACPPEDVGGVGGYEDFLASMRDEKDSRHAELVEWIGDDTFDAEEFSVAGAEFADPKEEWKETKKYLTDW